MKNTSKKFFAVLFVCALSTFFATAQESSVTANRVVAPITKVVNPDWKFGQDPSKEVVEKRNLTSKHFRNADGSYTAICAAGPIHYEDNGKFYDIDTRIGANNTIYNTSYPYANITNLMQSYFSGSSDNGMLTVAKEGQVKEFLNTKLYWGKGDNILSPINSSNVTAVINGEKLTYENIYPSIDAQYILSSGRHKLNYIIRDKSVISSVPTGAEYLVFSEDVELQDGWSYEIVKGNINLKDASGKLIYIFQSPAVGEGAGTANERMYEDIGNPSAFEVKRNGNTLTILTKVSADWVLATERVFPLIVDPALIYACNNAAYWTGRLYQACPAADRLSDGVRVGYFNLTTGCVGTPSHVHSWAKINLTGIPASASVTTTRLQLYLYDNNVNAWSTITVGFRKLATDPVADDFTTLYNDIVSAAQYGTANLGYTSSAAGSQGYTLGATANTDVQNAISQGWIAYGLYTSSLILNSSFMNNQSYTNMYGFSDASRFPYTTITYTTTEYAMSNTPVSTCNGLFEDSGGAAANYANNQSFTKTFSPATTGNAIKYTFHTFLTADANDKLTIYNGPNTSSPLVGTYFQSSGPSSFTSTDVTGAITFVWVSNGSGVSQGWDALISCVCSATAPTLTATANTSSTSPQYNVKNTTVALSQTTTGGNNCSGSWQYAWSNGTSYWNSATSTFSSATALYATGNASIAPTIAANTTYTCYVQASGGGGTTNSSITVNVVTLPTVVAKADGNTGSETVATGVQVALTTTTSVAGIGCTGNWEYAWSNGSSASSTFWSGTDFTASFASAFSTGNSSIPPTVSANKTYTLYVRCSNAANATATSTVIVNIGSCNAPVPVAKANGGTGTVTVAPSVSIALTGNVEPDVTNYCNGNGDWEYAWSNGTSYWNGSGFTLGSPSYNTGWEDISPTGPASGTLTYTAYVRCQNNTSCTASNSVSINVTIACAAPALIAKANGTATAVTLANNLNINLNSNPGGGANCAGTFLYAWRNGTGTSDYWDGDSFDGDASNYSASYSSILVPNVTTGRTFTALAKCTSDGACNSTSSVTVSIGACGAPALTAKANTSTGTITVASGDGAALTSNSTGGQYCDGGSSFEYAWNFDATHWWNGTDFSSSSSVWSSGFQDINLTNITVNHTYTSNVRCAGNTSCSNSSGVTINAAACAAPTVTAKANATASTITVVYNTAVTLTLTTSGGTNCAGGGTFEYSWFDGSAYWNGSSFGSATEIYSTTYTSLNAGAATVPRNYTLTVRCQGNTSCTNTSSVSVILGATLLNETWESGAGAGWTLGGVHTGNGVNAQSNWGVCNTSAQAHGGTRYATVKFGASGCDDYVWDAAYNIDLTYGTAINLTSYTTASLSFWYKSFGDSQGNDYGQVFLDGSINLGGGNKSGGTRYWGNATWTQVTIDLTPYAGSSHTLKFKWINDANTVDANPDPPFALDDIIITAATPLGTAVTSPLLYNTGGTDQLCFNNSHINTTTPIFRVSATSSGTFDTYQVEINTNSTFSGGTSYTQTFTGAYINGTQYNLIFNNSFTPSNGTAYYVRMRASGNGGITWTSWTSTQHSFVYDNTLTATEWYQGTQKQYEDVGYASSNLVASGSTIAFSSFAGGSNPFLNPSFETVSPFNWSKAGQSWIHPGRSPDHASDGSFSETLYLDFYPTSDYNSYDAVNDWGWVYQDNVNLTNVSQVQFDLWQDYTFASVNPYGTTTPVTFYVIVGPAGSGSNYYNSDPSQYGTVVYSKQFVNATNTFLNQTIDLTPYNLSGNYCVKFLYHSTLTDPFNYNYYLCYWDNIRATSTAPTTGTYTSAPAYLASTNGALNWSQLKWNQTLNGGTISFKVQKYNGSSWADVAGLTNLTASGDGNKTADISVSSDAQIRIVMTMNGRNAVLNNWALTATACTAPTVTAKANTTATSTTLASGATINLTANAVGSGSNCSDFFEYAWSDGTSYWNGSGFGSASALYDVTYANVNTTASSTKTYTSTVRCHAKTTCLNTSQVIVNVASPVTTISAAIGTPANGTQHHLTVSWTAVTGVDGYGLEYSTDGSGWTNITDVTPGTATSYDYNTGDNPNVSYFFRIRSKLNGVYSGYTTMNTPRYTACDLPAVPTLGGATTTSLTISVTAETPVANPAATFYSLYNYTTSQFVQANGSLGATEVYQTAAAWGTKTVTGLTLGTNYCFYAKAKNSDGDVQTNAGSNVSTAWDASGVENFDSYVITPNYCAGNATYFGVSWIFCNSGNGTWANTPTGGCTGNAIQYTNAAAPSGTISLVRSMVFSAAGKNSITVSFDMTNSYGASFTGDNIEMSVTPYSFDGAFYTTSTPSTPVQNVYFDHARNCEHVSLTYDISAIVDKSYIGLTFWAKGSGVAHNYNVVLDNFSAGPTIPTACLTTVSCISPTVTTHPQPVTICAGEPASFSVTPAGSAPFNYQWKLGTNNLTGATDATYTIASATTGNNGNYSVVVTNGCGNTTSNAAALTVNALPNATAGSGSPYCSYGTIALTSGPASMNSYKWSGPNSYNVTNNQAPTRAAANNGGTYTVTVTDGNGCSASATTSVTVNDAPVATAGSTSPYCSYGTISLSSGPASMSSYAWSNGASTQNTTLPANGNGGTYGVTVTNASGCTSSASTNVVVNVAPVATADNGGPYCSYNNISLTSTPGGLSTYAWSNGASTQNTTLSASGNGGTYSVTVTDSHGCTSSASTGVTVNVAPTINVSPATASTCPSQEVTLNASGVSAGGSYAWSPAFAISNQTGSSVNVSPTVDVVYNVTGTDANGCSGNATSTFTIKPTPAIVVNPTSAVCTGSTTATLTASGVGTGGSYSWAPATFLNATTGAAVIAQISQLTFYTLTGTAQNSCTTKVVIPVATVPVGGSLLPVNAVICSGGTQQLTAIGAAGNSYQWQYSTNNDYWLDISGATGSSYTTKAADATSKKYYRMLCKSNACWDVASTTSVIDISKTPVVTVTTVTSESATVTWTPFGTGQYNLSWSGTAGTGSANGVTTSSFKITGLAPNADLLITATPATTPACSGVSSSSASTHTLCAAPTIISLTTTPNRGFKIRWTAVNGAAVSRVYYRNLVSSSTWSFVDTAGTQKTVANIYGGTYAIYVAAKDCPAPGTIGEPSTPIRYITLVPASSCSPAPVVTAVSNCPNQLTISITGGTGNYSMTLRRISPTIGSGASYPVTGSAINITVGGQYAGSTWEVFARSVCAGNVLSDESNIAVVTVKPGCAIVNNFVLSHPTCHGFTASWNTDDCAGLGITGYQLLIKKNGATTGYSGYPIGTSDHANVTWLNAGITYNVAVMTTACNGATSAYSAIDTITVPGCRDGVTEEVEADIADESESVTVYPNPTAGQFWVAVGIKEMGETMVKIELVNQLGQVVQTNFNTISDGHLNELVSTPAGLATGIYFVRTTVGNNVYVTRLAISKE